jgi:hypothetical protein
MVEIPVNTKAMITLTLTSGSKVSESGLPLSEVRNIEIISKKDGQLVCKVGSGKYSFKIDN